MKLLLLSALITFPLAAAAVAGPAIPGGPLQCPWNPSDNFNTFRVTSAFDMDRDTGPQADWTGWVEGDPTAGSGHAYDNHSGTDWGMGTGTTLYACLTGTVTAMRDSVPNDDHSDSGNYIIYTGSVGGVTYRVNNWHLHQNSIVPAGVGSSVTQGAAIAQSNNTGNSTGPHLHFGAYIDSESGLTVCPFFNGLFTQDEYYWGDTRPCLRYLEVNASTLNIRSSVGVAADNLLTSAADGARFVASQRNGWYRIFLPSAPARVYESRTGGGVTAAPLYAETGAWTSDGAMSTITDPVGDADRVIRTGVGSRRAPAGSAATAQFVPNITQRGTYEVFATWPAQANASGVTYSINHLGGTANVVMNQTPGVAGGGTGTHANPYIIDRTPYVENHTTIGGDDTWDAYSPVGSGIPEAGPERLYRFTLTSSATVTATVDHAGYPGLDVDIQMLNTLSNTDCVARADWSVSHTFGPGTHYIAIDSYGSGASGDARATNYTLTVEIDSPMANSWVSLGSYEFDLGQSAANGSVTIDASTATGANVYADAIKLVPTAWRSAWMSDGFVNVLDGATDSVCCVGVRTDATPGNDARDIDDIVEIPILAGADPNSAVVGKALSGQRFVCTNIFNDFYRVHLPNSCDAPLGWISGEHLFVYHPERAVSAIPAGLTLLGLE